MLTTADERNHVVAAKHAALGAEPGPEGVHFEVWAPHARQVLVQIEGAEPPRQALTRKEDGYFHAVVPGAGPGTRYRFVVDGEGPYPDPRSRYQPEGPHGASMVVDPHAYAWRDGGWQGVDMPGLVIYELHVGTFTREGSFDAAARELGPLQALGVNAVEVMPVAEFPGRFNWGYDGVGMYAPFHGYGDPDAFRRFVDAAHGNGMGVILDVVYNHLGCDGNYLAHYAPDYFTDRYPNEWGQAINFDGENARPVRDYFIGNACYWVREFHVDGLRLDATQSMHDASKVHVLKELAARVRAESPRRVVLIAENEPQRAEHLLPQEDGGFGLDGMWNDDFHHSARVALTGRHDGYFHDHRGRAQEFVSAVRHGFLFQGQYYQWQKKARGSPVTTQPPWAFVVFLQNHDQVANTLEGRRLQGQVHPARLRAMSALLLLGPQTPLLFMGQEYGATTPFPFFADNGPELRSAVHEGRREFVSQFEAYRSARQGLLDPGDPQTFDAAKLDPQERERNAPTLALHRDLLCMRRTDPVLRTQSVPDGAVLSETACVLRWPGGSAGDRLLVLNFGLDITGEPMPEPLLAPPAGAHWVLDWTSEDPRYGGLGARGADPREGWVVPGDCASLYRSVKDPS